MKRIILTVAVTTVLAACSGGPSDSDFVQACMNQSGGQMVKVTEGMCRCAAGYARDNFNPKLRQVLMLDMQGKKQESESLAEGMSMEERGQFAMKQFEMVGHCLPDEEGPGR
jgi:hypothetical protein